MSAAYCTEEDVRSALDVKVAAYAGAQIGACVEAASRAVEGPGYLNRVFYPETLTRTFDWPGLGVRPPSWRIYTGHRELISLASAAAGGTAISTGSILLRPDDGPPYNVLEVDLSTSAAWTSGSTWQRAISLVGLWGHSDARTSAGTVATTVNSSTTTLDVTASNAIGVGSTLVVESERMTVTARGWLDTTQTLQTPMTASAANASLAVTTGTAFAVGESLQLDTETMMIVGIAGNTLTVLRAQEGSALAAHTAPAIYALRRLTVTRGVLGSTAAAHNSTTAVQTWTPPGLLRSLTRAEALVIYEQETSAYARVVGSGENEREAAGRGLRDIRERAMSSALRRRVPWGASV